MRIESGLPEEDILWQPTERQAEFLAAPDDEVLFGGAAGGGKSDALIVDALQLQQPAALAWRKYRGLLLRRTYPELEQIIDRARWLYPQVVPGAKWNGVDKAITFPSGAKIEFGYLRRDADRFQYQGGEFQWLGFDELTLYSSPVAYEFMSSRLRSTNTDVACYQRATCNPGGVGHDWVKERWRIDDMGNAQRFKERQTAKLPDGREVSKTTWKRFIPSRLDDNPHLAETDYRFRLMKLDEMTRRAMLDGRWDVIDIPGSIFRSQFTDAMVAGRICAIPVESSIPVNTFWDLGRNDSMAIWFHQRVGFENRFVDYYENSNLALEHYAIELQRRGYLYGEHYLPHDAAVTDLSARKKRREILEDAGVRPISVVPRVQNKWESIEAARRVFSTCWFDKQRCEQGIRALRSYQQKWDEDNQVFLYEPLHNWASNGSDAFQQFALGYAPPSLTKPPEGSWRDRVRAANRATSRRGSMAGMTR